MGELSNNFESTMSSVQLVEVINEYRTIEQNTVALRHDHFLSKIEKELVNDSPKYLGEYKSARGMVKCYNLPKDECILMLMSESRTVRKGVLKRLNELESKSLKIKVPENFREALLLAAEQQLIIENQNQTIKKLEPRSLYFDQMIATDGLVSMQEVAKLLNIKDLGRTKLFQELRNGNVIMKNSTVPYQHFVNKGYFELKEEIILLKNNTRKVNVVTWTTQKGLAFIFKFFGLTENK